MVRDLMIDIIGFAGVIAAAALWFGLPGGLLVFGLTVLLLNATYQSQDADETEVST